MVCVGVWVRRSKRGLSHRILVECRVVCVRGQGLQIQDRDVTGLLQECHRGCRWRCRVLVRVA